MTSLREGSRQTEGEEEVWVGGMAARGGEEEDEGDGEDGLTECGTRG